MDVKAEPAGETGVRLTWEAPREADPTTITYASGEIKDKGVVGPPENNYGVIAGVLFNDLMGAFIRIGAAYSTLFTGTENHAQRLYLKTGFRPARYFAIMKKKG